MTTHAEGSYATEPARKPAAWAPDGELERERLWMRAAAFGVDLVLLAGMPLVVTTGFVFSLLLAFPEPPAFLVGLFRASQGLFLLLFLCRDAAGLSPGKSLFGLRVVRVDGRSVTLLDSLARNLPLAVPGWNLVETFSVWRRPDARRPGDLAAGTRVIEA